MTKTKSTEPETVIDIPAEPAKTENKNGTVSQKLFEQLKESFQVKCLEYEKLLKAYQSMAIKYHTDGEIAKQFIKTAMLGIELLFPTTPPQGGQK